MTIGLVTWVHHRWKYLAVVLALMVAAVLAGTLGGVLAVAFASPAGAATVSTTTHSATSHLTNRPDSGTQGNNWANDTLTRHATDHLNGAVPLSHCGGATSTGFCYKWTATIADTGTATTIPGQDAPGTGYQNGGPTIVLNEAINAQVNGGASYVFYSSWKTADRLPPASEDGNPSGRLTTGNWPLLFFRATGPKFWDPAGNPSTSGSFSILTTGGWTYTAPPGADSASPNVTSRWVDASPDWGSKKVDGNILAPDATHS